MKEATLDALLSSITDRDALTAKGRACGAFLRQRKVRCYDFVLALLRSTSTGPQRSIAAVRRAWEVLTGEAVAASTFEEHFNPGMVRLLWGLVTDVLKPSNRALRRQWPAPMQELHDLLVCDGTRIALDAALADVYGGTDEQQAAIKLLAWLSLGDGTLTDLRVGAAVHHDRRLLRVPELRPGALYLLDLGFYDHGLFARYDEARSFFVSRLKSGVVGRLVHAAQGVVGARRATGKRLDQLQCRDTVDVDVELSAPDTPERKRVFRVVKVSVPRQDRHGKWLGNSQPRWYVTNLPRARWSPEMISVIYRLRWAIERVWREAKTLARLDQLRTERPAVVFSFVASSLLVWLLGARVVRELERQQGIGQVSHDRVQAAWIEAMPDVTSALRGDRCGWKALLGRLVAMFMHEGQHPNPSQPRVVKGVFDALEFEAALLPEAA